MDGGAVGERLGLLKEVCHSGVGFEVSEAHTIPSVSLSLSVLVDHDVGYQILSIAMPVCLLPCSPP